MTFGLLRGALASVAIFLGATTDGRAALPAQVYADLPEIGQVAISPDGQFAAMLQPASGRQGVTIYRLGTAGMPCLFAPTDVKISSISWASSRRVLVGTSYIGSSRLFTDHRPHVMRRYILINTSCSDPKMVLGELHQVRFSTGNTTILGHPPNDLEHLLVESTDSTIETYLVDPESGRGTLQYIASSHAFDLMLDESGVPRIRYDSEESPGDVVIQARLAGADEWEEVYRYSRKDTEQKGIDFEGFTNNPNIAYVTTRNGGDRVAAYEFDLKTKALGRIIYQNPQFDVTGYERDPYSRRILGVDYADMEGTHTRWFDQGWAQIYADVDATFPGSLVEIASSSSDRKKMIVKVEGPGDPTPTFYFYDASAPAISKIGSQYPLITSADLAPRKVVSYQSRDGLRIPAYVTTPPGASGKNMPLVIMPHGGPASRDEPGFDWWAQFVATRGFVVLQPQFRGSTGFGQKFEEAGHQKWGIEMQNDISDGVKWAIDQGIADPKKVCIVGWSYGGYAALAGVTLTPELYKCGIAVAGVSDLLTMLRYEASQRGKGFDPDTNYWAKVIGDPTRDQERLRATSPAYQASRVTASLLLIHGKDDTVVPIEQSRQMAQAMDRAYKPYKFLAVDGDDHHMYRAASRKQMLDAMDGFLQEQLK